MTRLLSRTVLAIALVAAAAVPLVATPADAITSLFFRINDVSANEDAGSVTFTVNTVANASANEQTSVQYATQDWSAIAPEDYVAQSGTLVFAPGQTTKTITVAINNDTIPEPTEHFFVNLFNPQNANIDDPQGKAAINANDGAPPSIRISDAEVEEGDEGTVEIVFTLSISAAPVAEARARYATADGSAKENEDYVPESGFVPWAAGDATDKTLAVTVKGDLVTEPDERFEVPLENPSNATVADPIAVGTIITDDHPGPRVTTGPGAGGGPHVRQFRPDGALIDNGFFAFETSFVGGVHVARGDVVDLDGNPGTDGIDEIIIGTGSRSRPVVRVFKHDGSPLNFFLAYAEQFSGGVHVAVGNIDGDTSNGEEIVTGTGVGGGPHVRIFRASGELVHDFFAYGVDFRGGAMVAVGNTDLQPGEEIVTGAGPGGGPHVRIFGVNTTNKTVQDKGGFFAYGNFTGGVRVGTGNFDGDTHKEIVTGPGPGGGPHVRLFQPTGAEIRGWFPYSADFGGGVTVAAGQMDDDDHDEIVTGAGPGGGPHVRTFQPDASEIGSFFAYDVAFRGGVWVAAGVS